MNQGQFFNELFAGVIGEEAYMTLWSPGSGTMYLNDTGLIEQSIAQMGPRKDIYFGLGLTKKVYGKDRRPSNLQISGIPGFWLDIDIAGPAQKKKNLPVSQEDALDLIEKSLPIKPTIIVDSGHGLHVYWLFKEPWIFESEDERAQAASLARRFVLSFKYHAAHRGWAMDSVFDLARVLRVPGSINNKIKELPRECRVIQFNELSRANPDEFEFFLVDINELQDDNISSLLSKDKNPLGLFLRPGANPPAGKMETMSMVEPKFQPTWDRKRTDFKDQSLSVYEMSLAALAASYRWKDQEIADLLIAFRRRHGKDAKEINKGLRVDYITRTILKTKKHDEDASPIDKELLTVVEKFSSNEEVDKDQVRDVLETPLQVRIRKIVKYLSDTPIFEIHLTSGKVIPIGTIDRLITQRYMKNILAAHCGVIPRAMKSHVWDEYATLMLQLVEEVQPTVEDATEKGLLLSTIEQYLDSMGTVDDATSAFYSQRPFTRDGKVYLFSKAFVGWAKFNAEPMTVKEFSMTAASMGIQSEQMFFVLESGKRTSRVVYDITHFIGDTKPKESIITTCNAAEGLSIMQ